MSSQNLIQQVIFFLSLSLHKAAGQQMVQQVTAQPKPIPGVVHRPQVQLIQNNVVTLSNVQGPADIAPQSHPTSILHKPMAPTLQAVNNRTGFTGMISPLMCL